MDQSRKPTPGSEHSWSVYTRRSPVPAGRLEWSREALQVSGPAVWPTHWQLGGCGRPTWTYSGSVVLCPALAPAPHDPQAPKYPIPWRSEHGWRKEGMKDKEHERDRVIWWLLEWRNEGTGKGSVKVRWKTEEGREECDRNENTTHKCLLDTTGVKRIVLPRAHF